ncbi:hypothetical protein [Streptomyces chartreusis]
MANAQKRKKPGLNVRNRLRATYGSEYAEKCCVITGDFDGVDWHHIDENPINSTFENLIPVKGYINQVTFEDYRRASAARDLINRPWTPIDLLRSSERWFHEGKPCLGYGAARIASRLVLNYLPLFMEYWPPATTISQSISMARHAGNDDLIADTIARDLLPISRSREGQTFSRPDRIKLLIQLAATCEDFMDLQTANTILSEVMEITSKSEDNPADVLRLYRRQAMGYTAKDARLDDAVSLLKDAQQIAAGVERDRYFSTTNALAWVALRRGDIGSAVEVLSEVSEGGLKEGYRPRRNYIAPNTAVETTLSLYSALSLYPQPGRKAHAVKERLQRQIDEGTTTRNLRVPGMAYTLSTVTPDGHYSKADGALINRLTLARNPNPKLHSVIAEAVEDLMEAPQLRLPDG